MTSTRFAEGPYSLGEFFRVPDGTLVNPFLNPNDSESGLAAGWFEGFSVAAGRIEPKTSSKIHLMPHVTQATFVLQGTLTIVSGRPGAREESSVTLTRAQAVLTHAGSFLQLVNEQEREAEVLYTVAPAYVFVQDDRGEPEYDDSVVIDETWAELIANDWRTKQRVPTSEDRNRARSKVRGLPQPTPDRKARRRVREKKAHFETIGSTRVRELFSGLVPELGLATASIDGCYPPETEGIWAVNDRVEEYYYVTRGKGRLLFADGVTIKLRKGVAAHMPRGLGYRIEAARDLHAVVPTGRAWTPDQHRFIR